MSANAYAGTSPTRTNLRWFVCFLLFLATTINYMDRSVLSLIEPMLHLPFMGWLPGIASKYQDAYHHNYAHIVQSFQFAYGLGLLTAGRMIDKLGTKVGYSIAIMIWALSSMSHSLVHSVVGFCIARAFLGIGESGNFPAAIKAVTEWFPSQERATATGLFNSGANASFFIAPFVIAAVTGKYGWRSAFICTGSMGLLWLIMWTIFPYNKMRRGSTTTQRELAPVIPDSHIFSRLLSSRGMYAFAIAKGLTDPIWWFYLFYLPAYLNDTYGLDLTHQKYMLLVAYSVSSVGSIVGGGFSGALMKRGHTVNGGRKLAMLTVALLALPVLFVPYMHTVFPNNAWPAIALVSIAAAAHQGWSANLFSTPTDMFPSTAISTAVGIGGFVGAIGGVVFTEIVGDFFARTPLLIFAFASCSYIISLGIFHFLVPRLGAPVEAEIPLSVP